ncbi:MAG TPA: hypothetical protein VIS72_04850 [Anaerolineales bacterium]
MPKKTSKMVENSTEDQKSEITMLNILLDSFQPVENNILRISLKIIPWIMLLYLIFFRQENWGYSGDVMWNLSYIVAIVSFFIMQKNVQQISIIYRMRIEIFLYGLSILE